MNKVCHARHDALALLVLIGMFFLWGCADLPTATDPADAVDEAESLSTPKGGPPGGMSGEDIAALAKQIQKSSKKARHFHLLAQAWISGGAGKMEESTDSARLVVGLDGSATADSVLEKVLEKHKILNRFEYKTAVRGMALTVPASNLIDLVVDMENNSSVSSMEPDPEIPVGVGTSNAVSNSAQELPWGISSVGADLSWATSGDGQGQVDVDLYIMDTGASHTDLNVVECLEFSRKEGARPCATTDDADGHGTGVAGVAAAKDNVEGIVGVAPGARVHALKVMRERGRTVLGSLIAVVDFLTQRKLENPSTPMVVNMSLGADVKTTRYNKLDQAIRASIAAGVVYVISAGNDGVDAATFTPAHVAEAITVGAYDRNQQLAGFSNYGAVIDILAPGDEILTLTSMNQLVHSVGTSFAAPYVAGAAALLLAQEPSLTPAQVRDRLVAAGRSNITGVPSGTTNKGLYVGQ